MAPISKLAEIALPLSLAGKVAAEVGYRGKHGVVELLSTLLFAEQFPTAR